MNRLLMVILVGVLILLCLQLVDLYVQLIRANRSKREPEKPRSRYKHFDLAATDLKREKE